MFAFVLRKVLCGLLKRPFPFIEKLSCVIRAPGARVMMRDRWLLRPRRKL